MKDYEYTEEILSTDQLFKVIVVGATPKDAHRPLLELSFNSLDMALERKQEYEKHFENVIVHVVRIQTITTLIKED